MKGGKRVDDYIAAAETFADELVKLRELCLAAGLEETVKWGAPYYTHNGQNVVGIAAFKAYVGLWFQQGALMEDPEGVFVSGSDGTKAMRQWRFQSAKDIKVGKVRAYLKEAKALAAEGKAVAADRSKPLTVPQELADALKADQAAAEAWNGFGKGKQREYCDHIASAKREATRASRLEKVMPMIAAGVGLNDKYRR